MRTDNKEYDEMIRNTSVSEIANIRKEQYNFQRWLLDDNEEIFYLQHALRGLLMNQETGKYEEEEGARLLNDKGARVLTETYLIPIIKNAKLSNFDNDGIKEIMWQNMREITRHLYMNMELYDLRFENLGLILTLFETYLKSVFYRALFGAEQDRLSDTQRFISQERTSNTPQDNGTSIIADRKDSNGLKGWLPF